MRMVTKRMSVQKLRVHEMQWSEIEGDRQRWNWYMLTNRYKTFCSTWEHTHGQAKRNGTHNQVKKWRESTECDEQNEWNNNANKCLMTTDKIHTVNVSALHNYKIAFLGAQHTHTQTWSKRKRTQNSTSIKLLVVLCVSSEMWIF